jgi:hypothetical protein
MPVLKQQLEKSYSSVFIYYHEEVRNFPLVADGAVQDLNIIYSIPYLSSTSEVLCFKNLFLAYCRTFALIGFSACCDF